MSKRQELRVKRSLHERNQRLMIIGGVALIALAIVLVLALPAINDASTPVGEIIVPEFHARPLAKFNAAGDPNAPVKIIVYSDFSCPHCADFWSVGTEQKILETYVAPGKVYFEYRSAGEFGRGPDGESIRAAEAAYCAGDQDKFWEMHDIIFANQQNPEGFTNKRLVAFAEKIGLEINTFKDCFNNRKYKDFATQDAQRAAVDVSAASNFADLVAEGRYPSAGISTPSFLINGKLIPGAYPFEAYQTEIEPLLK